MAIHTPSPPNNVPIVMSREFIKPWSTLLNFKTLKSSSFNKIAIQPNNTTLTEFDMKPQPVALIVSTSNPSNTIYHLKLDGSKDWNVWGGYVDNSILAYEDNSSLELSPSTRILFDKLSKLPEFNILKGRGNVLIQGQGAIVKLDLANETDRILINYKNLLAINGESQNEINHSINDTLLNTSDNYKQFNWNKLPIFQWGGLIKFATELYKNIYNGVFYLYSNWKFGYPSHFMEIKGPRSILLQNLDKIGDHSIIDYQLNNIINSDEIINQDIKSNQRNINFWNVRVYRDDDSLDKSTIQTQFTPTDGSFQVKK